MIANLLLDDIDVAMHEITNGNYWRYVDDVVFVGGHEEVAQWRGKLEERFGELCLLLHDGEKDFKVPCVAWLEGENDFEKPFDKKWITLVSDVKRFLLANPSKTLELQKAFRDNHIRIPVVDYSNAVKESTYLQRFQAWKGKYSWAATSVRAITVERLVSKAKLCEVELSKRLDSFLNENTRLSVYEKKRQVPKLRYLAGRLLYLLGRDDLSSLSGKLERDPELFLLAKTMDAVASLDMSDVVRMGGNATHIAAQLIRVECRNITLDETLPQSPLIEQSLAIIEFNGISHNFKKSESELRLLAKAERMSSLMNSEKLFIKEFACLHGVSPARHEQILDSSFDRDEELALDVLNQLQNSSHC